MPIQRPSPKPSTESSPDTVARPSPPPASTSTPPRRVRAQQGVKRTRTGSTWIGIAVGVLVLVLLIIFILQNTVSVDVAFLGLRGSAPLSVMLLIAGAGFAVVTLAVGSLRIAQLRRRINQGRPGPMSG